MEISPERLAAFQAIYRKLFDVDLTTQEALEQALPLLTLMKTVYQPMTAVNMERIQERRQKLFAN